MAEAVACSMCGAASDPGRDGDPPLGWTSDTERDGTRWVCPRCTRDNVRAIEAKLDREWW